MPVHPPPPDCLGNAYDQSGHNSLRETVPTSGLPLTFYLRSTLRLAVWEFIHYYRIVTINRRVESLWAALSTCIKYKPTCKTVR